MKRFRWVLFVAVLLISVQVCALGLDAAKNRGLVGEQPDGYLGVVEATADAVELVAEINQERREAYARIAREHGITLEQVARIAGKKAIEKTDPGNYVQTQQGRWVRK